jgi:hypothetical protein
MISDRSRPGVLDLPRPSPQQFGAQAGQELAQFGQALQEASEKIQRRQDELDLTEADNLYRVNLDALTTDIAKDPNLASHGTRFQKEVGALQDRTLKQYPNLSRHAQQVLGSRFSTHNANATIDLAHNIQKVGVGRALASYADMADAHIARAALSTDPAVAADALNTVDDHRERNVRDGLMDAPHAQKDAESRQHQYWVTFAQHQPQTLLGLPGNGNDVMAMDPSKRQEYRNLAVSTLHTIDAEKRQQAIEEEKAFKANQIVVKNEWYARTLRGEVVPQRWYEDNKVALGDQFDEVATKALDINIKGGPGAGSDHVGQWEKRILVDNEVGAEARRKIFVDPKLNRDQRVYLEAKVRTRETELESGKDAKYFANEPRFKDYEVRVKRLLGDAPWLPILKPGDQKVLGEAIVELRARVEAASLAGGAWQSQIPEIAAQVMVNHQPRLSGGVSTPKDWQGDLEKSVKELQKEFRASGSGASKTDAALLQNPEYRRRATQLLTYEAYVKRFPNRLVPSTAPSKGTQEKPNATQELFQKLLESSAEES